MSQWFLSYDGKQIGPFSVSEARTRVASNKQGYAWREGFREWIPIAQVQELVAPSPSFAAPPPPLGAHSDELEYQIIGSEMQFVEIELDPNESCLAEAGAMMYKDPSIVMEAVFDTGSRGTGFVDKLLGAGKRVLTGESLFMTQFQNQASRKAKAAFAAPYPGNIIPVHLSNVGGSLICQKDSFLCAARGISIGIYFQKKILTGLFGGEGFIMQKLEGDGLAFIHAGGTLVERTLQAGESLHVDTGCIVAFQPTVAMDIQQAGNIKTLLFGGEGVFFATLQGPGKVWLQSLPFSRLAGRMLAASLGGKEEGSVLGQLGSVLQGDR